MTTTTLYKHLCFSSIHSVAVKLSSLFNLFQCSDIHDSDLAGHVWRVCFYLLALSFSVPAFSLMILDWLLSPFVLVSDFLNCSYYFGCS